MIHEVFLPDEGLHLIWIGTQPCIRQLQNKGCHYYGWYAGYLGNAYHTLS